MSIYLITISEMPYLPEQAHGRLFKMTAKRSGAHWKEDAWSRRGFSVFLSMQYNFVFGLIFNRNVELMLIVFRLFNHRLIIKRTVVPFKP